MSERAARRSGGSGDVHDTNARSRSRKRDKVENLNVKSRFYQNRDACSAGSRSFAYSLSSSTAPGFSDPVGHLNAR